MNHAECKENFAAWLRRAWTAAVQIAEAMDRSPVEELFIRIDRLEHGVEHGGAMPIEVDGAPCERTVPILGPSGWPPIHSASRTTSCGRKTW